MNIHPFPKFRKYNTISQAMFVQFQNTMFAINSKNYFEFILQTNTSFNKKNKNEKERVLRPMWFTLSILLIKGITSLVPHEVFQNTSFFYIILQEIWYYLLASVGDNTKVRHLIKNSKDCFKSILKTYKSTKIEKK